METSLTLGLLKKIESQDLMVPFIEQLNKDAHLAGLEIKFETNLSSAQLVGDLYQILLQLITADFGGYLNYLYRIDVPERAMQSIIDSEPESIIKQVTYLVLKREWQKVSLRNKIR